MKPISLLISRYLLSAIIPYFVFAWLLLSIILFVQQASRYSDIFFNVNIPGNLIWQLALALLPNVIAFTCPMAILVGTIIGLSRLLGDSELVAIRAAGVGNLQIALPILLLGLILSGFAFFVNLKGVPFAAQMVRSFALQGALKKLESPLEPGVFNSELAGFTIYVRTGDFETGRWKNIFVFQDNERTDELRLITASNGRIDFSGPATELVLDQASVHTISSADTQEKYVSESIGQTRIAIKTKRSELAERLTNPVLAPEELGLGELTDYAAGKEGSERLEALIIQHRRVTLSIAPAFFCVLGTFIVLRLNRGGRNFGILLGLAVLLGYYLLAFLGEQLARSGHIGVLAGSLFPVIGSLLALGWFYRSRRIFGADRFLNSVTEFFQRIFPSKGRLRFRDIFIDLSTGLRDFDLVRSLLVNYLITVAFLSLIFVIFTAFELWKFAGTMDGGLLLLVRYLFFLMPFVYLQVAPSAAMISAIATYAIKSRQNELVTWAAAGQSIYRLVLPCFILMGAIGISNWLIQEFVLPGANQRQDSVRETIRNKGVPVAAKDPRNWSSTPNRIYSFHRNFETSASDNEKQDPRCPEGCISKPFIFELAADGVSLTMAYRADRGEWQDGRVRLSGSVEEFKLSSGEADRTVKDEIVFDEAADPFVESQLKPAHLNSSKLRVRHQDSGSETERRNIEVVLEKRNATVAIPLVLALFTVPFALTLGRRGRAITIGYAMGMWLCFVGVSIFFEQLGLNGSISARIAILTPLTIFSLTGIYLLTKVRT